MSAAPGDHVEGLAESAVTGAHLPEEPGSVAEPSPESVVFAEPTAETAEAVDRLADLAAAVAALAEDSRRYHQRAEQRENLITALNEQLDTLRRGERRSLLRPSLAALIRLRDDLRRQAGQLPENYDAVRAAALLQSFADEIEVALADNGVTTESVAIGDAFDPRTHRGSAKKPAPDPALVGTVAEVRSDRYVDVETGHALATASVVVYVAAEPVAAPAAAPVAGPDSEPVSRPVVAPPSVD
jgi:molecular chaperone GrpE